MKSYVTKKKGVYWPSKEMKKIAWINDSKIYKQADKDPVKFWGNLSKEGITWEKEWAKKDTYVEKLPYFKWFKKGKLNFCVNVLDRHIEKGKKDKRSEEHTSELQSHSFISYAVFCLKKKKTTQLNK